MMKSAMADKLAGLVNLANGTVDRSIFADREIYEIELQQIFARAWLFVCHESQISQPGDFFLSFMGEDRVICVRDTDGAPQVMVNSCRHRGNAICRAEEGHATSFMCTYHGWTYDLEGRLVGVPGFKEVYHEELERENWGLIKAAGVASYRGFVFATMDAEAPSLDEFLNQSGRFALDLLADKGEMLVVSGIEKYVIGTNWKFPMDNAGDFYHTASTHASVTRAGYNWTGGRRSKRKGGGGGGEERGQVRQSPAYSVVGEYGHIAGLSYMPEDWQQKSGAKRAERWRIEAEARGGSGPLLARIRGGMSNIFPNAFMSVELSQIALRLPKGPMKTEIWYFTLSDSGLGPELQKRDRFRAIHTLGASGLLEQDDSENWDQSTKAMRGTVSQRVPLNYQMGLGRGEIVAEEGGPAHVETHLNENLQLWQYRSWAEWMAAESWPELKANHSLPESVGRL